MKQKIAFAVIMGLITTGLISFTIIAVNVGFTSRFPGIWIRSWGLAYLVAVPVILVFGPIVSRVVNNLFREKIVAEDQVSGTDLGVATE